MRKNRGTAYGVIGLGRFGTALAIALAQAGKEVIAIDRSEEKIKNLSDEELNDFYQTCLIPKYYPNVVAELKDKKNDGYLVYICSASIEGYLRFCDLPVDGILGTKTEVIGGKYTSRMIGNNCKNEEKITRLTAVIAKLGVEIDYENSYAYSDSMHDIPMLKMVKNRIRINKKNGEMTPFIIEE